MKINDRSLRLGKYIEFTRRNQGRIECFICEDLQNEFGMKWPYDFIDHAISDEQIDIKFHAKNSHGNQYSFLDVTILLNIEQSEGRFYLPTKKPFDYVHFTRNVKISEHDLFVKSDKIIQFLKQYTISR